MTDARESMGNGPVIIIGFGLAALLLGLGMIAVTYFWADDIWVSRCAQHRPLADCQADLDAMASHD